jgi:nicotinamide mononucleotide transporter
MQEFFTNLLTQFKASTWYEHVAVVTGIISVWCSKKENVLVYPIGLISTIIYIYLSFYGSLFGEATVNMYYTIMSIIGWYLWMKKSPNKDDDILQITYSSKKELQFQFMFFSILFAVVFFSLTYLNTAFNKGTIPWADGFATATAFTGMYLMVKKKVESWYWWIATNIASIPLYYYKDYVVTSVYYVILLVLAFYGLKEWKQKAKKKSI